MVAVFGESVQRKKKRDQHDGADEDVEKDGEGAGFDGSEEAGADGEVELPEARPQGRRGAERGYPAKGTTEPADGHRCIDEHDHNAGDRKDDFGKDAEAVGRVHGRASAILRTETGSDGGGFGIDRTSCAGVETGEFLWMARSQ